MVRLFVLFLCFDIVYSGNILLISQAIGRSHVRFIGNIADVLARDGHNVTILKTPLDPSIATFGNIETNIETIDLPIMKPNLDTDAKPDNNNNNNNNKAPTPYSIFDEEYTIGLTLKDLEDLKQVYTEMFEGFLQQKEFIENMKNKKFDVLILENIAFAFSVFSELFDIPVMISASAIGSHESFHVLTGIPQFSSFVPVNGIDLYNDMTFMERLQNTFYTFKSYYIFHELRRRIDDVTMKHYPHIQPTLQVAQRKTPLILVNGNEFTESPRPVSSMIEYIGGALIYETKELDAEWLEIVNRRESTVIMSFGTYAISCVTSIEVKKAFVEAFEQFPNTTFIWKYNNCKRDELDRSLYENIVFRKWIPQTDLLAHTNVKLFITHAGLNSIVEAQTYGVPMITVPLFGDQLTHSVNAEKRGIAIRIEKTNITSSNLAESINKLLSPNNTYQRKIQQISLSLKGRSEESRSKIRQKVMVLISNGEPLDDMILYANHLNFIQLHNLDIFVVSLLFISLLLFAVVYIIRYVVNCVFGKKRESVKKDD